MPKVGKMKFPYTEKGMKDAKNYAKQSGKPMEMEDGGMMPEYGHGGMVNPMMRMYKHGGLVMSPMQKMALRKRLSNMMMGGGKVHSKKKKK